MKFLLFIFRLMLRFPFRLMDGFIIRCILILLCVSSLHSSSSRSHVLPRHYTWNERRHCVEQLQHYPSPPAVHKGFDSAYVQLLHATSAALLEASPDQARTLAEQAVAYTQNFKNQHMVWHALSLLQRADAQREQRMLDSAQATAEHVLHLAQNLTSSVPPSSSVRYLLARTYIVLAWVLDNRQRERETGRQYFSQAAQIFQELGRYSEAGYAMTHQGICEMYLNRYRSAETTLLTALELCKQGKDPVDIAFCYFTLGDCASLGGLQQTQAFDKAISSYVQALTVYEVRQDTLFMGRISADIAVLYRRLRLPTKAMEYARQSVLLLDRPEFAQAFSLAHACIGMGNTYLEAGHTDSALVYFLKALTVSKTHKDQGLSGDVHLTLGKVYRKKGEYSQSIVHLERSIRVFQTMNDKARYLSTMAEYCVTLNSAQRFSDAVQVGERSLRLADSLGMHGQGIMFLQQLAYAYEQLHQYPKAYYALQRSLNAEISMLNEKNTKALAETNTRYETEKKEQTIRNLEVVQALQNEELRQNAIIGTLLFAGLLSVGGGGITILRLYRKQKRLTVEVFSQKESLELLNAELQQSNLFKTEILGIASHDLKNPLSAIELSAEIGSMNATTPMLQKVFANIINSSKHVQTLIEHLLDMAGRELGKLHIQPQLFTIASLFREVSHRLQPLLERKHQSIAVELSDMEIHADFVLIRQLVENLISNASKYSPEGAIISLRAEYAYDNEHDHNTVHLIVQDQGQGMNEEDISRLGGLYQKLSPKPTHGESSSGIGLYIVKQILQLHNGSLTVESEGPGKGSAFIAILPASLPHTSSDSDII